MSISVSGMQEMEDALGSMPVIGTDHAYARPCSCSANRGMTQAAKDLLAHPSLRLNLHPPSHAAAR
ncbi:hypothetical protein NX80_009540 [Xanthomonas vasicola pv. arecae]|nr:hypothetical protein NX80_009540 [Xanthomonas vasicola pv. arecae]